MKTIGVVMEISPDSSQSPKPRLNSADRNQVNRIPIHIDNLIESDHSARIIWTFVDGLDLSPLYEQVHTLEGSVGRAATDAKILMALWLCGGVGINHHTLSDFWYQHEDYLQQQFTLHLCVLIKEGLIKVDRVAQDGVRIRANAGAASFRRKEMLKDCFEDAKKVHNRSPVMYKLQRV